MTNHPNRNITAKMRRWDNAKLDRELRFGRAALDDNHPENVAWLRALEVEADRRSRMSETH